MDRSSRCSWREEVSDLLQQVAAQHQREQELVEGDALQHSRVEYCEAPREVASLGDDAEREAHGSGSAETKAG